MSRFRRLDLIDSCYSSPLVVRQTSIFEPPTLGFSSFLEEVDDLSFPLHVLSPSPLDLFDSVTDLVHIDKSPSYCSYQRIRRRVEPELPLQYLCDRVSALEWKFERLASPWIYDCDRKYTWTTQIKGSAERKYKWEAEIEGPPARKYKWEAEINGPAERKYKWTAEIKGSKKDDEHEAAILKKLSAAKNKNNYRWITEIKSERENGEVSRTYTIKASTGGDKDKSEEEKKEKKCKKKEKARVVEMDEPDEPENHGVVALRQAFARRTGAVKRKKGKKKELSPEAAAVMIQVTFRAYLIRRSKALRALRELAVAKTKLKEIRTSFNNFNYRRHIARDAEECQKFSEKIIVLLLTVDAIEGVDLMVRAAKRSMVDELEAMLDVVDPQPTGKSHSMKRRTFDMPDSVIRKEIADGVTQIVQMLETEE